MLFDLRSRGRRRTVQVVYLGLAVLMGGGLVLFGVGARQRQRRPAQRLHRRRLAATPRASRSARPRRTRSRQTQPASLRPGRLVGSGQRPLVQRRRRQQLQQRHRAIHRRGQARSSPASATAWQRYAQPDQVARSQRGHPGRPRLRRLGQTTAPGQRLGDRRRGQPRARLNGYECLAASAYAAKQTRKGDLALAKALSLVPKLSRTTLKQQIAGRQDEARVAQSC